MRMLMSVLHSSSGRVRAGVNTQGGDEKSDSILESFQAGCEHSRMKLASCVRGRVASDRLRSRVVAHAFGLSHVRLREPVIHHPRHRSS
jgi:hypothetical protein